MFQGWGRNHRYFEGWYYKLISADYQHAIAVIPGISYSETGNHAFIQTMDGIQKTSRYERFDLDAFKPDNRNFEVAVGGNNFNNSQIDLHLPHLSGSVRFLNTVPYEGSFFSPGIMGWYSFVPFMQCYHGLVSIDHQLDGALMLNDLLVDFTGGKGYIEKDWGSSFPEAWVWTQCNNFENHDRLSIMASVAHIPWLGSHFIGFLAIVYLNGKIKVFTTYTNAKMSLDLQQDWVEMSFSDKESHLTIKAWQQEGTELIAPQKGAMTGKVNESIQASHEIRYRSKNDQIEARGSMAGLEVGGNSRILLSQKLNK
jgi:hypothetical protein